MTNSNVTAPAAACRGQGLLETMGQRYSSVCKQLPIYGWLKRTFHHLLQRSFGKNGIVCTLPGGEHVRVLPQFRHLSWNLDEYAAFKEALRPGHVALDVGANLGCYSLLFARWVGPEGRVFAFEPAPEAFRGLSNHIRLNNVNNVVQPWLAALSDQSGEVMFRADGVHGHNRMLLPAELHVAEHIQHTSALTIDAFCAREGIQPNLIKIDVEGFELAVLRGAEQTIREGRDRLELFVEMHPTIWPKLGISKKDVVAELERQGLRAQAIVRASDPWSIEGCCMKLTPASRLTAQMSSNKRHPITLPKTQHAHPHRQ